jgi:hypothetical protein
VLLLSGRTAQKTREELRAAHEKHSLPDEGDWC